MNLYTLTSLMHGEMMPSAATEPFIRQIEEALGRPIVCKDDDFRDYGTSGDDVIYVRTGGTEGLFKQLFWHDGQVAIPQPVRLLTSGQSNSLAASMEILAWLNQHGVSGRIIHGSLPTILDGLTSQGSAVDQTPIRTVNPHAQLAGRRLGVIGHPSDWLISSDVDYADALEQLGVDLIDIPMDAFTARIGHSSRAPIESLDLHALNPPRYGRKLDKDDFSGALDIYCALEATVREYALDGLTLRCFDLLSSVGNTGCLGLAILNARGITATCEGDIPTLLTMDLVRCLCGTSAFQANLSRIDRSEGLFAHCTVPLDLVDSYTYDTHFESGIGVAVHGEFSPGPATLFKLSADLRHFIAEDVMLKANAYGANLCRTQVIVQTDRLADYLLREPLGNHHVILPGHRAERLRAVLGR